MDGLWSKVGPQLGVSGSWGTVLSTAPPLPVLERNWLQGLLDKHSNSSLTPPGPSESTPQAIRGGRVPLSTQKRQRPAVPEMPLRPRGRSLEENSLPTSAWPWLPPNSLPAVSSQEHHHVPGRAQPRAPAATTGRSTWRPQHRVVITGHTHRWSFGNCYLSLQSGFVLCLLLSD